VEPHRLAEELGSLVGATVGVDVIAWSAGPPAQRYAEVTLRAGAAAVTLGMEPDLGATLLARALGRPLSLAEPGAPLSASLSGALAALAVEVARRFSHLPVALETTAAATAALRVDAVIRIDQRAYAAYALVGGDPDVTRGVAIADLEALGEVPLTVPLAVGASLAARADVERLVPGVAFLPS
jgi:hypothetical protein